MIQDLLTQFSQFTITVTSQDFLVIGLLVFLEGILSIDNALVLAILARSLPASERRKALTYGLVGAFVFRLIAIGLASYLIHWTWVKFLGGGYLLYVAISHLWNPDSEDTAANERKKKRGFWGTILVIELTDIAFALDSILAAVALTQKVWIIVTGGFIGLVIMRFAASVFIRLLDRFPAFEQTAYYLVGIIGTKVVLEGFEFEWLDFHSASNPEFWVFWVLMAVTILQSFIPRKKKA